MGRGAVSKWIRSNRTAVSVLLTAAFACAVSALSASEVHPAQTLVDRASIAVRTDPELSRRNAEAALALLAKQPNADLEIRARLMLCDYLSERDREAAEKQIGLATALLPKAQRPGLRAGVLDCRGTIMETAGDNATARGLYEEAVSVASVAQDDEMLAAALFSRGYLLGLQGQYAAGLTDLKRAQALYDQLNLAHHSLTALNGIAIMYNRMGDYAQARDMYSRALIAQRGANLRREQAVTLHNLGRAHENLQEWSKAKAAFSESVVISRELSYPRGEAYALRGLAAVANAQNDPQSALETLERAALLQRETPDARLSAQIQLARGIALHKLRRLSDSAVALEEALNVFEAAQSSHELRETYATRAALYADLGNWREAYVNLSKSKQASEQLLQNQLDQRFATLKVEFDTAAKEQENQLLTRENAANQKALEHERRARSLQRAVIVLTGILALMLATLAIHQWRTTRRMRSLALTDELTGVPNRRAVLKRLDPLLRSERASACAMLIIDIDHFKSINDQFGHPEGDEALKLVARCLREEVIEPAFIGRLGGEEFIVVAPGADVLAARELAERFRTRVMTIDTRRWLGDRKITVSTGVTIASERDTPTAMLKRADAALYEAKRAGRNCVRVQMPSSHGSESVRSPVAGDPEPELV
jgi:diguanylate cyclase (GGDEF)-like protein